MLVRYPRSPENRQEFDELKAAAEKLGLGVLGFGYDKNGPAAPMIDLMSVVETAGEGCARVG